MMRSMQYDTIKKFSYIRWTWQSRHAFLVTGQRILEMIWLAHRVQIMKNHHFWYQHCHDFIFIKRISIHMLKNLNAWIDKLCPVIASAGATERRTFMFECSVMFAIFWTMKCSMFECSLISKCSKVRMFGCSLIFECSGVQCSLMFDFSKVRMFGCSLRLKFENWFVPKKRGIGKF